MEAGLNLGFTNPIFFYGQGDMMISGLEELEYAT